MNFLDFDPLTVLLVESRIRRDRAVGGRGQPPFAPAARYAGRLAVPDCELQYE